MKITNNFLWSEATRSDTADALRIDNSPTPEHKIIIQAITAPAMESVREACGNRPINVTSWYRSPTLNKSVKGVATSDHALGLAVDFHVTGMTCREAAAAISDAGIRFDQLIHEASRGILHISFHPRMRRQVMTQELGPGTPFKQGI